MKQQPPNQSPHSQTHLCISTPFPMPPVKDTSQAASALMALAGSPSKDKNTSTSGGGTGVNMKLDTDANDDDNNQSSRSACTDINNDQGSGDGVTAAATRDDNATRTAPATDADATHTPDVDMRGDVHMNADTDTNTNGDVDPMMKNNSGTGSATQRSGSTSASTSTRTEPTSASTNTNTNTNTPPDAETLAQQTSNITRFPNKLMAILDSNSYNDVVCWSPDGTSFVFHDCDDFERVVLPDIFKVAKFDSFLRKLYRWGFSKCQAYSRVGCPAYKHEKFIRDRPELLAEMECRSKPKTQYSAAVPLTLNSFQAQSAPQLRRESSETITEHSHGIDIGTPNASMKFDGIPNAVWQQQAHAHQGMSPLSSGIASGITEDPPTSANLPLTFSNVNANSTGTAAANATATAADILKNKIALATSIEEQNRLLTAARASIMNNSSPQTQHQLGGLASLSGPYRNSHVHDSSSSLASAASTASKKRPGSNLDFTRPSSSHRSLSNFSSSRSRTTGSMQNRGFGHGLSTEKNQTFQLGAGGQHHGNAMANARKMLDQLNLQAAASASASNNQVGVGVGVGGGGAGAGLLSLLQNSNGEGNSIFSPQQRQAQAQAGLLLGQQQQQQQKQLEQALAALNAARVQSGLQQQGQGNNLAARLQAAKILLEQQNAANALNAARLRQHQGGEQNMASNTPTLSAVLEQDNINAVAALNAARLGQNNFQQNAPGDNNLTSAAAASVLTQSQQQPQVGLSLEQQNLLAALAAARLNQNSSMKTPQSGAGDHVGGGSQPTTGSSSNGIPNEVQSPALGILQLLEEHDRLEQQMKNQLELQNQVNRLRIENEMKRQLLRNEVNRRQQEASAGQMNTTTDTMQNDVSQQARILQDEVARRVQLQNEVQRALMNNLDASNEPGGNGPNFGNQGRFSPP